MKFASFRHGKSESFGLVKGDAIVDAQPQFGARFATLRDAIAGGALGEIGKALGGTDATVALKDVQLLPVITNADKILCAGVNYRAHAAETGREIPVKPSIFSRLHNTMLGNGMPMVRPTISRNFDFEGELAVIIGKAGHYIKPENALDHVAGYSCFNDGSIRDYQKYSVTAGKNFPASGPLGPWMVTADEIPDPAKLTLLTRLNGVEMQRTTTDLMIHSVQDLIAYCSEFTHLVPGDVIATGTPDGVGHKRNPQVFMKGGDVIEVEISSIGILRNPVVDEA